MKMAKRALAVVLSLVMAFSAFSIVGSAAMNTSKVFAGNDNTLTQGIDIFKVVDGTPVETELTTGSNLEPGDVIEVRVKIGTDFYAQSVSSHICYDSTIFTPYKNGAVYTTVDTVNFGKDTNFFKTYEDDVATSDGYTWYQTLNPDDKLGRAGAVNTFSAAATTAQKNVARIQYTPVAWKQGGKPSGAMLADYAKYHFVSVKFVSGTEAESAGTLIKVPYDTYFSFQLQVLDGAETAEGATTSVWIPLDAVKSLSTQSSNKVTADAVATNEFTTTTADIVGYGHTVDLTDGEVEFTIGKGVVEPEPDPEPTMYTVTFAAGANGSLTGETSVTVEEGTAFADIALPTAVADAGYKFAGWTGAPETITADVTVTANFEYDASQYATVTFAAGDNGSIVSTTESVTVLKGTDASEISFPEAIADAGYKFAGWDLTGTINADVTATANFEYDASQWATVTFAAGANGTIAAADAVTVLKGTDASEIEFPEATANAGYKFAGWDLTGAITADVTATATFVVDNSQYATVTFVAGANGTLEGETTVTVLKGTSWDAITFPTAKANAGYAFAGWDNAGATVDADVTVTASFESTEATVTVNVYTMDTTGAYGNPAISTFTATIGAEASVDAADYESEGFYVDTDKSLLAVESVAAEGATLNVYVARTVATYTFLVPDMDDDTFTQYDQDEYYYGATIVLPIDPSVDGYEFMGWMTDDGANFTGGTAGAEDVTVTAAFEKIDTSLTDEDLAALTAATTALPDPENLYFYTDEAILSVAAALGSSKTDADDYIEAAIANGYVYEGAMTKAAVTAAAAAIAEIAANINVWVDGKMPNRDESKANIGIKIIPSAINGEEVTPDANNKVVINEGDIVTFDFNLDTDYYLSALYAQVLYDTNLFDLVDVDDYVYTQEDIEAGEAYAEYILETTTDRNISRNYDIACESVESFAKQYHASVKNNADFMEQYKIILISVVTKAATNSKAMKFDDAYIASFRLKATEDVVYDGTISSLVGVNADWYADADNKSELLAGTRGTGYKADGTTVANKATSNKYSWSLYDNFAQYGQTFTSTLANVQFGEGAAPVAQYTVTFAAGENGKLEGTTSVTVDEGTAFADIALPTAVADAGYKFAAWSNAPETITEDVTVTAIFRYDEAQWATVEFAAGDNGSIADAEAVTVLKGTDAAEIEFPEVKADPGYKFAGWDLEGAIEADVTATAQFEYDAEQWATVTFAAGDNGSIEGETEVTVLKGTSWSDIEFPEAIADAGYEFAGWDNEGNGVDADVTVTAQFVYDADQYATVTFAAGANGSIADAEAVTVLKGTDASEIEFPEATADAGYKFVGWDLEGAIDADVTATAQFEYDAEQWVTVEFAAGDNGSIADAEAVTVLKGTDAAEIEFPEVKADPGYKFAGWDLEGAIEADVTATAQFEYDAEQWATVTFVAGDNGSIEGETEVTVLKGTSWSDIEFPEAIADAGYEFAGWDNEGNGVDADVTVTASFEMIEVETTADVLWAGYEVDAEGNDADAETIYVIAKKDALKLQIRNTAEGSSLTYSRTHTSVVSIEAIEYLGVECELWAINRALAPATFIAVAKYADSDSIDNISAELGYEFEVIAETPDYDDAVYSAKIENAGEYDGVTEQTIIIETGLDVSKIQLLNNDDNGTMTYGRIHQNVTVEEVDGKLVWKINKIFAVGKYSFSIIAKSVAGWADSDIDLDFEITAKVPENNAPVVEITVDNGVPTATVKTSANVRKVKFTNVANGSTFTYAKTNANVTVETTADGLTWTIALPTHSANTFNYNVAALLGSSYSVATPVTFTVTK